MLDNTTKRRIDSARDILVGKVPDPKSQVEQITIALIYKFMDDMDAEAADLGGERKFFAGEYEKYGWQTLISPGLGGQKTLELYMEAIGKMPENPGIPALFRDIFKNAYLPYRDPETLRQFLKIINEFEYDHSERLGDAFEYLLSVLGSQGDAGQFRTPRHIIDFIVKILDPKKDEKVLDPACGTAGFLISAYKHIASQNVDAEGNSTLSTDERIKMATNFLGYDISPDMVRLSLVNLYLHGFTDPHIYEYDTLTSQERWKDSADVILANPPFMSPKGGIQPHNRFSVQSNRSEVLFVDYIAEHLTPNGRAGIVVPEGIIFQSQTAYKALRKMLVEEYLVAVISLPAGVFNPYSGVKTSILVLDRSLAKQSETIAFFRVENDGFGLGAQRRAVEKNDLPQVETEFSSYICALRDGTLSDYTSLNLAQIVFKQKIAANGEYNLSGERYREGVVSLSSFPSVDLGEACELVRGVVFSKEDEVDAGGVQVLRANNINKDRYQLNLDDIKRVAPKADFSDDKKLTRDDIFICLASGSKDHVGKVAYVKEDTEYYFGGFMGAIRVKSEQLHPGYLFKQLTTGHFNAFLREQISGANINNLSGSILYRYQIPLPPLYVQREIVAEIEGYQRIIDGARAVVDNYRPQIPIHPNWPMVKLGDVIKLSSGRGLTQSQMKAGPYIVYGGNGEKGMHSEYFVEAPNLVIGRVGAYCGAVHLTSPKAWVTENALYVTQLIREIDLKYLGQTLAQLNLNQFAKVGGQPSISQTTVYERSIALPPLATQQAIVAEIDAEQTLVNANRELITRFEQKIRTTLARIWGEDSNSS
jgi:type I restriction enzyme M protein